MMNQTGWLHGTRTLRNLCVVLLVGVGAWQGLPASAAVNGLLQGQDFGNTNWVGGPVGGWAELDFVPCRVRLTGGPGPINLNVTFENRRGGVPAIQNLYSFTASAGCLITNGPTLIANSGTTIFSYNIGVNVLTNTTQEIVFYAKLSAGSRNVPGASMSLGGSPSLGNLGIQKPISQTGNPDLSVVKTGPTNANAGQVITYGLNYANKKPGDGATGVQLVDQLPNLGSITFVSASGPYELVGDTIYWDLGNLVAGAKGRFLVTVQVNTGLPNGTALLNSLNIVSAQNESVTANNTSNLITRVASGCIAPTIADPPLGGTNCVGTSVTFDVVGNGSAPLLYQWRKDSIPIAGATNATYTIASLVSGDAGNYDVILNNSCGSVTSAVAVLTVPTPPSNSISGPAKVCALTSNLTYSVSTSASAPEYSWSIAGNGTIAGATTNASVVVHAGATGSFALQVAVTETNTTCTTITTSNVVINTLPVAGNDSYSVDEDDTLDVAAPGVLGNDTDANGDALAAVLVASPAAGSLSLNADGSFSYTPTNNFYGSDSFTYRANDGCGNSNLGTVTITVNPVNDVPVVVNQTPSVNEDEVLNVAAPGVLSGASDADGDPLTALLVSGPTSGLLTLNADGSYIYTPNPNFFGTDSFTFAGTDGVVTSATATVTITVNAVNDAPTVVGSTPSMDEDDVLNVAAPGVLTGANDVEGDPISAVLITAAANGLLTLNADGSYSYTPNPNFFGTDSFTFAGTDGVATGATATVIITINNLPDAPVVVSSTPDVDEDNTLNVAAPGALAGASDADDDPITALLVSDVSNGTLTFNGDGSYTYTPNANFNGTDCFSFAGTDGALTSAVATVCITVNAVNDLPVVVNQTPSVDEDDVLNVAAPGVLTGATDADGDPLTAILVAAPTNGVAVVNADGSYSYTPNANFFGEDCFTFAATDGVATSAVATVCVTVNSVPDAPVVFSSTPSMDEDGSLDAPAPGALAGAFDGDGDPITAILITNVSNGTLVFNPDGSYSYTPAENFNGSDCFVFAATDGVLTSEFATVCITVNSVNDAPVAADNTYNTPTDTPLNVVAPGILANDTDVDGDALTAVLVSNVTHGVLVLNADGSFSYTPDTGFVGTDEFTYVANDGTEDSNVATVTIHVGSPNNPPVAVDDSYNVDEDNALDVAAPGVLDNDSDADGDALFAALVSGPTHGALTFNSNGSFRYTPTNDFFGTDTFTYEVSDGQTNATATVTITVNPVNDPPTVVDQTPSVNEDSILSVNVPGVLAGASDPDGDPLTAILVAAPTNGVAVVNADGSYSYTPNANFFGEDCFTFAATDGVVTSAYATVCVTVTAVADVPLAADDAYETDGGVTLNVAAPGVLGNDSDADGDPLTAVLATGPASGDLSLNADGSFTYVPEDGFSGEVTFTYQASDGTNTSNIATVTITVTAINNAPVAVNDTYSVAEDDELNVAAPGVLGNDSDPNGDPLTAILVTPPAHGTLTFSGNGAFDYVPDNNFNGVDTFTYQVTDGVFTSNVATVTITVTGVNGAGDIDLLAASVDFKKKWTAPNRDLLQIKGRINPRGARSNLNGASIQLTMNGTNILDALVLDSTGNHQTRSGAVKVKAFLSSKTGRFKLKFSGLDLEDILDIPNVTNVGYTELNIQLTVTGADLDVPEIGGRFETPWSTFADKYTLGRFRFRTNRTLSGVFQSTRTSAKLGPSGGYIVGFRGAIENENGHGLTPTGNIHLRIGNETFVVPLAAINGKGSVAGLKKFRLVYDLRRFQITTAELDDTGIPAPGVDQPTSHRLPMMMEIPTGASTNVFETIIELKRATGLDTKWKR